MKTIRLGRLVGLVLSRHIDAQYKPDQPASLMVFMDGSSYARRASAFRVPVVFDNLIHQKAMPLTIAVFVNPGTIPSMGGRQGP